MKNIFIRNINNSDIEDVNSLYNHYIRETAFTFDIKEKTLSEKKEWSKIFKKDRSVFTFSMHCKSNYPAKKSNSDLDVELKDNTEDREYIDVLKKNLLILNKENFDLIFYIAGVDIHHNDRLGKLKITDEGIKNREELVISNFFDKKIPLCGVLGGGYNKDFKKLVELHAILHKSCASILWKKLIQNFLQNKN